MIMSSHLGPHGGAMKEIFRSAGEGVMDGLREAPREFIVPFVLFWRAVKSGLRLIDDALEEARKSAHSTEKQPRR
jgi:hypothetical protein